MEKCISNYNESLEITSCEVYTQTAKEDVGYYGPGSNLVHKNEHSCVLFQDRKVEIGRLWMPILRILTFWVDLVKIIVIYDMIMSFLIYTQSSLLEKFIYAHLTCKL